MEKRGREHGPRTDRGGKTSKEEGKRRRPPVFACQEKRGSTDFFSLARPKKGGPKGKGVKEEDAGKPAMPGKGGVTA